MAEWRAAPPLPERPEFDSPLRDRAYLRQVVAARVLAELELVREGVHSLEEGLLDEWSEPSRIGQDMTRTSKLYFFQAFERQKDRNEEARQKKVAV